MSNLQKKKKNRHCNTAQEEVAAEEVEAVETLVKVQTGTVSRGNSSELVKSTITLSKDILNCGSGNGGNTLPIGRSDDNGVSWGGQAVAVLGHLIRSSTLQ